MSTLGMPVGGSHFFRRPASRRTVVIAVSMVLALLAAGGALASVSVSNQLASAKRDLVKKIERTGSELDNKVAGTNAKVSDIDKAKASAAGATFGGDVNVATDMAVGGTLSTSKLVVAPGTAQAVATPSAALTVNGDSAFVGDTKISGNQEVSGSQTVSGGLSVAGTTNLHGTVSTAHDLNVGGNLGVSGNQAVSGNQVVGGSTTIGGQTTLQGGLSVTGQTNLSNTSIDKDLTVGGNLAVTGRSDLGALSAGSTNVSSFSASGQGRFNSVPTGSGVDQGSLYINPSSAGANDTLFGVAVNDSQKFRVDASGNVYGNNLILNGNTTTSGNTLATNLEVLDNTILGSASSDLVTVNASSVFNAQSTFNAATTLNGSVSVTGANPFTVGTGATSLGGTLGVSGNTNLGGTLGVTGATALAGLSAGATNLSSLGVSGTTTLTGATSLGSSLNVSGATALGNTLSVTGNTSLSTLSTSGSASLSSLAVTNGATVGGNLSVTGVISGNGSGLTNLNGSDISSGTVADARLSPNVALLDRAGQTFSGNGNYFTGGNVGIGTNTPASKLHVSTDGLTVSPNLLTSDVLTFSAENNAVGLTGVIAGSGPGQRPVFKGVRARGTLANPTAPLQGDNVVSLLGAIYDGTTTQATAAISGIVDGPVSAGIAPQRIGIFTSATSGGARTEKLTVSSSGNVGIGTSSPLYKLDVSGGTGIVGQFSGRVIGGNAVNSNEFTTKSQLDALTSGTAGAFIQNGNSFGALAVLGTNDANSLALETNNVERLRIDTAGNVGIGTTAPGARLDVVEGNAIILGADVNAYTRTNATVKAVRLVLPHYMTAQAAVAFFSANSTSTGSAVGVGGGNAAYNAATTLQFYTAANGTTLAGTERLRIDSAGNVGIGTTSPAQKLDVVGNTNISGTLRVGSTTGGSGAAGDVVARRSSNTGAYYFGDSSSNYLYFDGTTYSFGNASLYANTSGNVGIGTSSPLYKLDVSGGTGIVGQFSGRVIGGNAVNSNEFTTKSQLDALTSGTAGAFIQNGNSFGALAVLGTNDANSLALETNNVERLRIDTAGNVGIGTTAPSSLLHLNSSATTATALGQKNARIILQNYSTTLDAGGEILLGAVADTATGRYASIGTDIKGNNLGDASGDVYIATKANATDTSLTRRLVVQAGGNVGIGTTAPGARLDVRGNALFKNSADSTTAFQVQTAAGTSLLTVDSTNQKLIVKNLEINGTITVNGHVITGNTSGTTTVAAGAGAGTGPTVTLTSGNDTSGKVTIVTGTTPTAGTLATITFANAYGAVPKITLTPQSAGSFTLGYYSGTVGTGSFTIDAVGTPTASSTYTYTYHVEQ